MSISLLLWITAAVQLCSAISGHKCSYQIPRIDDDVILGVPLQSDAGRIKREEDYRNLRVQLYYDDSIANFSYDKQFFINSTLLPDAVGYWSSILMVRRSNAPIRLSRKCESNHYYILESEQLHFCAKKCREVTKCGETIVPDQHLYQCRYCESSNPLSCSLVGPPDGVGVSETDFLLYVSAVATERCENVDTVAYAAHCQQEAELDRPIAGHVNLCPNAISTSHHDQEVLVSTVRHEILHALGFSAGLYAFFRNDDGSPRTPRNKYGKPISLNRDRGYYDWDENTIQRIVRDNWWTRDGNVTHSVDVVVTSRVRREVIRHFNCTQLEGAELENQGGDGTALTHWEKRLLENEAMTGTHTQNPVYSRITLALMEDSGWYRANYSVADDLHWGNGLGCDFAMRSCGDWIRMRRQNLQSPFPYCNTIKHDGQSSRARTTCTDDRNSLALCNLIPYENHLPIPYRNFDHLAGVNDKLAPFYGGSVELADFCPYKQEFEWKSSRKSRRDSRCEIASNTPPDESNAALETYGIRSKCFNHAGMWTQRKCGRELRFPQYGAGCYQYLCLDGLVHLEIFNSSRTYPCYYSGQQIAIRRLIDGWLVEGIIICPPCEDLCLPGPAGFAGCAPDRTAPELVSDPVLPEPCRSGRLISLWTVIFFSLVPILFN